MLDTRENKLEFLDGHKESLSTNLIAQHLYCRWTKRAIDMFCLATLSIYKRRESAIGKEDAFVTLYNGINQQRQMTHG
jgi:hypothetical protein